MSPAKHSLAERYDDYARRSVLEKTRPRRLERSQPVRTPDWSGRSSTPRTKRLVIAGVVLVLVAGGLWWGVIERRNAVHFAPAAVPAGPYPWPGLSIDLDGWKVTLPVAGKKGHAANITPAVLAPPWLVQQSDGSLRFWAPVCGVTTPNSDHPRTELDSLSGFTAGNSGPQALTASLAVSQVPSVGGDIIVGQIHGSDDISSVPFVMLRYSAGQLRVVVKKSQSGASSDKFPLLSRIPLGGWFEYSISDNGDGTLTVTASHGPDSQHVTVPIPPAFRGATVRFQAGNYQQGVSDPSGCTGLDGAMVTFAALRQTRVTR